MISLLNRLFEKKAKIILLLFLSLQIPSIRVLFKYVPNNYHFIIAFYFLLSISFYYLIVNTSITQKPFFTYPFLAILLMLLIIGINYYLYPVADSLKYLMKGSDQDDAIIVVVKALFSGNSPYAVKTYFQNPPSPGPGLVLIMAPFVMLNAYFLATPFFLLLLSFIIYRLYKNYIAVNLLFLLVISAPAFWELMINGSDLLIIGILMLMPVLLWTKNISSRTQAFILTLIAIVLTSRVVFLYLAPIYGLILAGKSDKNTIYHALKLTLIISLITIAIHAIFYSLDPSNYAPLHLMRKGTRIVFSYFFISLLLTFVALVWLTIHALKTNSESSDVLILWLWVALPMLVIAIISLSFKKFDLTSYPFTYLGLQLPVISIFYVVNAFSKNKSIDN